MIEKLSEYEITSRDGGAFINVECNTKIINTLVRKINELVDAVNSIVSVQEKLIDSRFVVETKHEAPADPYAEKRKWAGKLCRFWNTNKDYAAYEILEEVVINWACRFKAKNDPYLWDHCEPVKPDDDIIYKGE